VDQYRYSSGLVQAEDLAEWYGTLDVLCAASYGEGFGIPVIEAQGCGVPVVATACSSMEEINPYGINVTGEPFWNGVHRGWWTRPSIRELTSAFRRAYEQRGDVDRDMLRQWVAENYEVSVVAEKHMKPAIDRLLDVMAARKGSAPSAPEAAVTVTETIEEEGADADYAAVEAG
jgi:glycosyltransferase involved in cell wall biosynthesis